MVPSPLPDIAPIAPAQPGVLPRICTAVVPSHPAHMQSVRARLRATSWWRTRPYWSDECPAPDGCERFYYGPVGILTLVVDDLIVLQAGSGGIGMAVFDCAKLLADPALYEVAVESAVERWRALEWRPTGPAVLVRREGGRLTCQIFWRMSSPLSGLGSARGLTLELV